MRLFGESQPSTENESPFKTETRKKIVVHVKKPKMFTANGDKKEKQWNAMLELIGGNSC